MTEVEAKESPEKTKTPEKAWSMEQLFSFLKKQVKSNVGSKNKTRQNVFAAGSNMRSLFGVELDPKSAFSFKTRTPCYEFVVKEKLNINGKMYRSIYVGAFANPYDLSFIIGHDIDADARGMEAFIPDVKVLREVKTRSLRENALKVFDSIRMRGEYFGARDTIARYTPRKFLWLSELNGFLDRRENFELIAYKKVHKVSGYMVQLRNGLKINNRKVSFLFIHEDETKRYVVIQGFNQMRYPYSDGVGEDVVVIPNFDGQTKKLLWTTLENY